MSTSQMRKPVEFECEKCGGTVARGVVVFGGVDEEMVEFLLGPDWRTVESKLMNPPSYTVCGSCRHVPRFPDGRVLQDAADVNAYMAGRTTASPTTRVEGEDHDDRTRRDSGEGADGPG
jgi:hypothetical protein